MIQKTRAVVLHTLKYGDTGLVVTVYTESSGRMALLLQGTRSKKSPRKANLLQPLFLIDCEIEHKAGRELQRAKELKIAEPYITIPFDITKSTEAIFIAEVLYKILKEEEAHPELFTYVYHSLRFLDLMTEGITNFHLVFLVQLTRFLGFSPENNHSETNLFFDLVAGTFVGKSPLHRYFMDSHTSALFSQLIKINFNNCNQYLINSKERKELLNLIIEYYSLHFGTTVKINSLEVLQELFAN